MNADDRLQFVDTNMLVYAHDSAAGAKREKARRLLDSLWSSGLGCLSVQVLQEFYTNITAKVPRPLSPRTAAEHIEDLSTWRVHRPGPADVLDAITLSQRYGVSFWDAMIIQSATQLRCRMLWSEDLNTGQAYGSVLVGNPFESGSGAQDTDC